jgi:hypothetical protein
MTIKQIQVAKYWIFYKNKIIFEEYSKRKLLSRQRMDFFEKKFFEFSKRFTRTRNLLNTQDLLELCVWKKSVFPKY